MAAKKDAQETVVVEIIRFPAQKYVLHYTALDKDDDDEGV